MVPAAAPDSPARLLLTRLKYETNPLHLAAEQRVRIHQIGASEAEYALYLEQMLGFHAPIEAKLQAVPKLDALGFESTSRVRAHLLKRDLLALGRTPASLMLLPMCSELPGLQTVAAGLGCAYVLEGSTLGGQFILRAMKPHLGQMHGRATAFLEGYGVQTGPMWKKFAAVLARAIENGVDEDAVIRGANATFSALILWLDRSRAAAEAAPRREAVA